MKTKTKEFVCLTKKGIEYRPLTNYARTLLSATDYVGCYELTYLTDTEKSFNCFLRTLSKLEKDLLCNRFQLRNVKRSLSNEELAKKWNVSTAAIEMHEKMAMLRMQKYFGLKQDDSYLGVQKKTEKSKYSMYVSKINEILQAELFNLIMKGPDNNLYLNAILERNDIEIIANDFLNLDDQDIEEVDWSLRTYNCLKRSGIHTIAQLYKMTDDDLRKIRNLGRRGILEIREKLAAYYPSYGGYIAGVKYLWHGQLLSYSAFREYGKLIFDSAFSPRLLTFLLMRGFLFEKDVIINYKNLIDSMKGSGIPDIATEFESFIKSYSSECKKEYAVISSDRDVMEFLQAHSCENVEEVLGLRDIPQIDSLQRFMQCVRKNF